MGVLIKRFKIWLLCFRILACLISRCVPTYLPTSIATNLYHMWLVSHLPDFRHVSQLLIDQRTLKHDQHEQCEQRVVPVLVQAPETNAKHLKQISSVLD